MLSPPVFWLAESSSDAGETDEARAKDETDADISPVAVSVTREAPADVEAAELGGEVSVEEAAETRVEETRNGDTSAAMVELTATTVKALQGKRYWLVLILGKLVYQGEEASYLEELELTALRTMTPDE